jgi:hypothetical protein
MSVNLNDLKADTCCQARECMDERALEEYAEAYRAGEPLPPIEVFEVEAELVIVDGFHRHEAARRAGVLTLAVRIVGKGSMADAEWHALASNQKHGLRRTREDKRSAVRRAIEIDSGRSNREIARHVGVSDPFVGKIRSQQQQKAGLPRVWLDSNLVTPAVVEVAAKMNEHSFPSMKVKPRNIERIGRLKHLSPYLYDETGNGGLTIAEAEWILCISLRDQHGPGWEIRQKICAALRDECEPEIEAEKEAAKAEGWDVETHRKSRRVLDAANEEPEKYGDLPKLMTDADGVGLALKTMIRRDMGLAGLEAA